ncbi:restriction endonuclease subunit S, partial [Alistipes onderdonkii]
IRHTSPDKIKDCTVWIPELAEQKRISKLLRSLDCKIGLNRAINQNLPILDRSSEEGEVYLVA